MPLESLTCTNCGSADVKEVKADTYFCDHCETVFKHIDPSRVTVQREFCECGGPIAFQCRVCRIGICRGHDVCEQGPSVLPTWIPTTAPAYRFTDGMAESNHGPFRGDYYVRLPDFGRRAWSLILGQFQGGEVHLCVSCVFDLFVRLIVEAGEYDELARGKVAGEVCAHPACEKRGSVRCRCCGLSWCFSIGNEGKVDTSGHAAWEYPGVPTGFCNECRTCVEALEREIGEALGYNLSVRQELRELNREDKWHTRRRRKTLALLAGRWKAECTRRFEEEQHCERLTDRGVEIPGVFGEAGDPVFAAWVPQ